jgi:hypothetical protein
MRELTKEEVLEILCAPEPTDEPEESDFEKFGEEDEMTIENWIEKEMN